MFQNAVNCSQGTSTNDPIFHNVVENEPSTSVKKRRRTYDEFTFELQAYNKRPKVSDSLIPVQSSLYLCNVQDMKAWKYIDLTWSFSHFLNP
jgi:hypothetical protein